MTHRIIVAVALVAALCLPVSAQQPMTVDRLLDRMADAVGGRERLTSLRSVATKFAIEAAGLKGTGETLTRMDGRSRTTYDLAGVDGGTSVFDGAAAWRKDLNGDVRKLEGSDLEEERSEAYFDTFSHLLPGRRAGRVELLGPADGGAAYLVRLSPDGGRPVTVHVDAKTFLVTEQESPEDDGRVSTTRFADWREVDGVKFAFRSVQHAGPAADTKFDVVVAVTDLRTNVPADDLAFAKPEAGAADFRFASGSSATGIPIELNANHIFVQVRVNGSEPRWFLFDTGAEATVVDAAAAKELGLTTSGAVEARGSGEGSMSASFVKDVTLSVGGADVLHQTIFAIPLGAIATFEGRRIDGIVGYDFTSRFVVEIDYARRQMSFRDPKGFAYSGEGDRLPITMIGKIPFVKATIEQPGLAPDEGLFLVDTGSRLSLVLNAPFVREHAWAAAAAEKALAAPYGIGIGGESKTRVGRLGGLRLGSTLVKRPIAGFSFDTSGSGASAATVGAIGGEVLRRFDVIFDYAHGEMILTPNAALDEPFEYDMLGALLTRDATSAVVVIRVVPTSSADDAGLKPGDRLESIDGRPIAAYSLESLGQLFRTDGKALTLGIRRGSDAMDVKVTLRRLV